MGDWWKSLRLFYLSIMKWIVVLLLGFALQAPAQDTSRHFSLAGGKLIWQKTYSTQLGAFELMSELKAKDLFQQSGIENGRMTGVIKPFDPNIAGAGYIASTAPVYLFRNTFHGEFLVAYTGNGYQVTVQNMMMVQKFDEPMAKEGEILPLDQVAIDREGHLSAGFVRSPSAVLDYTIDKIFTVSQPAPPPQNVDQKP